MKTLDRVALVLAAVVLVAQSGCAAEAVAQRTKGPDRPTGFDGLNVEQVQKLLREIGPYLLSPSLDCVAGPTDCEFTIPVKIIEYDVAGEKRDYCLAQFPDQIRVKGSGSAAALRKIVWRLEKTKVTSTSGKNYNLEFHDDRGIIVVRDDDRQISRVGLGDRPGSKDTSASYAFNLRSKASTQTTKIQVIYLPVIKHINAANSDDVGVCATGDPKMINE